MHLLGIPMQQCEYNVFDWVAFDWTIKMVIGWFCWVDSMLLWRDQSLWNQRMQRWGHGQFEPECVWHSLTYFNLRLYACQSIWPSFPVKQFKRQSNFIQIPSRRIIKQEKPQTNTENRQICKYSHRSPLMVFHLPVKSINKSTRHLTTNKWSIVMNLIEIAFVTHNGVRWWHGIWSKR